MKGETVISRNFAKKDLTKEFFGTRMSNNLTMSLLHFMISKSF